MAELNAISADEIALYDRQIRLWGMTAQNRSKLLVINLGAVANEVVKNLVLAGIGSLTVLDSSEVHARDLGAQFFVTSSDIGANRGEAAKYRIQRLNPRVALDINTAKLSDVSDEWLAQFDIVIGTELSYSEAVRVNDTCRSAGKPFFTSGLFGLCGYVFSDLVVHKFQVEKEKSNVSTVIGKETPTRSVVEVETRREGPKVTEIVTKQETYKPLSTAVKSTPFSSGLSTRKLLKTPPLLPTLLALWELSPSGEPTDADALFEASQVKARSLGLPASIITSDFVATFARSIGAELSPVAAVVGGVLSQDVLNVLSQKEQPLQNLFVFNGRTSEGPVYTL